MNLMKPLALSSLALLAAVPALAQAGNNSIRAGVYIVSYDAKAADLSGPYTPTGLNIKVDSLTTAYFAYLRNLSPHWTLELTAGVPPTAKTVAVGPATVGSVPFNGQVVATTKWFSTSLLLEYVFFKQSAPVRPFLGVGVNATHFMDNISTPAGNAANGGPTKDSLTNSVGPAATGGLVFNLGHGFEATASYSFARVKSNFTSDTAGIIRTTSIDFRPTTWVVALGYNF